MKRPRETGNAAGIARCGPVSNFVFKAYDASQRRICLANPRPHPVALPAIPAELLEQFGNGPMTAESINAATLALKKALIERALGGEMNHRLGYSPDTPNLLLSPNQRNGICFGADHMSSHCRPLGVSGRRCATVGWTQLGRHDVKLPVPVSPLVAHVMGKGAAKARSRGEPREPGVVGRCRARSGVVRAHYRDQFSSQRGIRREHDF